MNLEKIGLLFLINYFNQLGEVKNHLQLALKEVLLALSTSINIVSQSTAKGLGDHAEIMNPIVKQVQGLLNFTIDKVSPHQAKTSQNFNMEDGLKLKEHIVGSIISAIDDEIEGTSTLATEKGKLKVEALQTVRQVLINQRTKPFDRSQESSHTVEKKGFRVA